MISQELWLTRATRASVVQTCRGDGHFWESPIPIPKSRGWGLGMSHFRKKSPEKGISEDGDAFFWDGMDPWKSHIIGPYMTFSGKIQIPGMGIDFPGMGISQSRSNSDMDKFSIGSGIMKIAFVTPEDVKFSIWKKNNLWNRYKLNHITVIKKQFVLLILLAAYSDNYFTVLGKKFN